jgi:hypothetical protein
MPRPSRCDRAMHHWLGAPVFAASLKTSPGDEAEGLAP